MFATGGALDDASEKLKADKELVLVAVKTQGAALSYVHQRRGEGSLFGLPLYMYNNKFWCSL